MRILFSILAFTLCQSIFSQTNSSDSLLTYTGVISVDSAGQKELALRARQWFSESFKSPKDVLQVNDIDNGEISGNGSFTYTSTLKVMGISQASTGRINVKISIWTKEGRYKYELGPFTVEAMTAYSAYGSNSNNIAFAVTRSDTHPGNSSVKMNQKSKDGLNAWWQDIKRQCDNQAQSIIKSLEVAMKKNYKGDW